MQGDAYGMFLVHYPIVLWLQYWLFDYDLPAIVKATIAFVLTVALSWAVTAALRQDSRRDEGAVGVRQPECDCEAQAEAIHLAASGEMDCFASLAMTWRERPTTPCRSYRPAASARTLT